MKPKWDWREGYDFVSAFIRMAREAKEHLETRLGDMGYKHLSVSRRDFYWTNMDRYAANIGLEALTKLIAVYEEETSVG